MEKIKPAKKGDIESKLAYAQARMNALHDSIFKSRKNDVTPDHLPHEAGDVVAAARECLDYLAIDIFDAYSAPTMTEDQIRKERKNVYFPFSQNTLDSGPLRHLKVNYPELYAYLNEATGQFLTDGNMPGTILPYKTFPDMRNMVDTKKHHDIIAIQSNAHGELIWEGEHGARISMNISAQQGWSPLEDGGMANWKRATEYRFTFNDTEVAIFCSRCIWSTKRLVKTVYSDFFARKYFYGNPSKVELARFGYQQVPIKQSWWELFNGNTNSIFGSAP